MILREQKLVVGQIDFEGNEKVLSFGVDGNDVLFWSALSDKPSVSPRQTYVVLENGDEVREDLIHVATLADGIKPKHIFVEKPKEESPKNITKLITSDGVEVLDQQN